MSDICALAECLADKDWSVLPSVELSNLRSRCPRVRMSKNRSRCLNVRLSKDRSRCPRVRMRHLRSRLLNPELSNHRPRCPKVRMSHLWSRLLNSELSKHRSRCSRVQMSKHRFRRLKLRNRAFMYAIPESNSILAWSRFKTLKIYALDSCISHEARIRLPSGRLVRNSSPGRFYEVMKRKRPQRLQI